MDPLKFVFGALVILAASIINIVFAVAVKQDADRLIQRDECLFLVGPELWSLATLFGGVTVVALYWAVHYSSLRPKT
jgi:hypothetical protein